MLVSRLMKLPGWFEYSGDYSYQAAYRLPNGRLFRVGMNPNDKLFVDIYEGLKLNRIKP